MARSQSGIEQLVPVESANLHQRAYAQMRHAIMSGAFGPGETLTLRGLAAALGTSIMPARDAVLRLVAERALENLGRRVRVPMLTLNQMRDVERFRILLEGEAVALAAQRASEAELAGIAKAYSAAERAYSGARADRFLSANQEFHFAIYRAAHNDLLLSMIERLWLQIGPHLGRLMRQVRSFTGDIDLSAHERLLTALRRRDAVAARAALAADLKDSTDIYRLFGEDLAAPPVVRRPIRGTSKAS